MSNLRRVVVGAVWMIIASLCASGLPAVGPNPAEAAIFGGEDVSSILDSGLASPRSIAVGPDGSIFVADANNHRVQKLSLNGTTETVAGVAGSSGSGMAQLNTPTGVAVDTNGNVYVADSRNHRVQMVTPQGVASTVAGTSGSSGPGPDQLRTPTGVAIDDDGNLYIADLYNHRVQMVTSTGVVTTVLGTTEVPGGGTDQLRSPSGVAVDTDGNLYVADVYNHRVQKLSANGEVTTIAGITESPGAEGSQFRSPSGVATDRSGNVYVADKWNHRVRKITSSGEVSTVAGTGSAGSEATDLRAPSGVAIGHDGSLLIADTNNHRVQKLSVDLQTPTIAILTPTPPAWVAGGSRVELNFVCEDVGGSTLIACSATIDGVAARVGDELDTSAAGRQTLVVLAVDGQGNETTRSVVFEVAPGPRELTGEFASMSGIGGTIARLYMAVFRRQPDLAGHRYWLNEVESGLALNSAVHLFVQGPEFRSTYPALSDGEFISALYQNVMNRQGEVQGLRYWTERLGSGLSRETTTLLFGESPEFKVLTHTS